MFSKNSQMQAEFTKEASASHANLAIINCK